MIRPFNLRRAPLAMLLPLALATGASFQSLAQGIQGTVRNPYTPEGDVKIELFVDAETGEALASRKILLVGHAEFTTDRLGRCAFHDFPGGQQRLEFQADGYRQLVIEETLKDLCNRLIVRLRPERPGR